MFGVWLGLFLRFLGIEFGFFFFDLGSRVWGLCVCVCVSGRMFVCVWMSECVWAVVVLCGCNGGECMGVSEEIEGV